MKLLHALNTLGICSTEDLTKEEAKRFYRKACLKYHPDKNPVGLEMMKMIVAAWETLQKETFPLKEKFKESEFYDYGQEINAALNKIINLPGIIIEVCGSWVWVSNSRYEDRKIFCPPRKYDSETKKALPDDEIRFKWSKDKGRWYFRPQNSACFRFFKRDALSMEEIKRRYGATRIKSKGIYQIPAYSRS